MIKAVKGTRDLLPPSTDVWNRVESVARAIFRAYNYHEIRTPILEETQLFARGVGEETDIVTKEMYTFDDHGTSLTLRPENTLVIRAYIEHRLDSVPASRNLLHRPDVPPRAQKKGRYRQFFQIGAEAIGSDSPLVDAEVIELVGRFERVPLGPQADHHSVGDHNCRPQYVEKLRRLSRQGRDHVRRLPAPRGDQPPRVLIGGSRPARDRRAAFHPDSLCPDCVRTCRSAEIPDSRGIEYEIRPAWCAGWTTTCALRSKSCTAPAQNSVLGGGRYDGLAESLGSKIHCPVSGFDRRGPAGDERGRRADRVAPDLYRCWARPRCSKRP